jgi:hypothetical protein
LKKTAALKEGISILSHIKDIIFYPKGKIVPVMKKWFSLQQPIHRFQITILYQSKEIVCFLVHQTVWQMAELLFIEEY